MNAVAIWSIVAIVVLMAGLWLLRRRASALKAADAADRLDTVADWPPAATRVLTTGERLAYKSLNHALPGHMILAQVPLARFLKVPTRHSYSEWLRRLGNQCADLVVCDMASEVIAVVSVESATNPPSERARKRQQRMARVLKAARIPLHVWADNAIPTPDRVQALLLPQPPSAPAGVQRPAVVEAPTPAQAFAPTTAPEDSSDDAIEPPPSTWFDEFNSGPVPLRPPKPGP